MAQETRAGSVAEELGRFTAGVSPTELPPHVVDKAKACIAHGLVVAMAGNATEFGDLAEAAIGRGEGPCRLLTSGARRPAAQAAFVNAALAHGRVQEDTHGTTHLGSIVLPAALAAAEETDADGATLLAAIVAGYEVGAAVGRTMTSRSSARGFRASPIYGALGAAAAAARIRGLEARDAASAIAFASAFTGGTLESFAAGTMEWHFQNAIAAQSGILAAGLAAAGGIGARSAFEGDAGFLTAFCGTRDVDEITAELGTTWEIPEVTFKLYPVCAFNQIPVAAAVRASERAGLAVDEIDRVEVEINDYELGYPGMDRAEDFSTVSQTLMSTRFAIAVGLLTGGVAYDDLRRFDDAALLSLVDRIDVAAGEGRPPMTARVALVTSSGETFVESIDDAGEFLIWGFDDAPRMAAGLIDEGALSKPAAAELLELIGGLEDLDRAGALLDPLLPS